MFRVCGPGRTQPTGTLTILDDDGDGNAWFDLVSDKGERSRFLVKGYRVGDLYPPNFENPTPTGTVTGAVGMGVEKTWHYFKELPVTAEKIVQTVSAISAGPVVKVT